MTEFDIAIGAIGEIVDEGGVGGLEGLEGLEGVGKFFHGGVFFGCLGAELNGVGQLGLELEGYLTNFGLEMMDGFFKLLFAVFRIGGAGHGG